MQYAIPSPALCKGPCVICGMTDYALSMGGQSICPSCDCGIEPTDPRHMRNLMKNDAAKEVNQPVLMPASRDELLLSALEKILRELQLLRSQLEILNNQVAWIQASVAPRQSFEQTRQ